MGMEAILKEVKALHGVGANLERLAETTPRMSDGLLRIAQSVHSAAILLAVLATTKG